jgi:hypothetical protein
VVTANEFSHVVKISEVGNHSRNLRLLADETARNGLMARFDLAALDNLEAEISLKHEADAVIATGRFTASLAQFCIATHDPVPAKLDEPIHIQFMAEPTSNGEVELELAPVLPSDWAPRFLSRRRIIRLHWHVSSSIAFSTALTARLPESMGRRTLADIWIRCATFCSTFPSPLRSAY